MSKKNLFGNIVKDNRLRSEFVEPPFTVLDTRLSNWQKQKNKWKNLGIKSEVGRDVASLHMDTMNKKQNTIRHTSIFDPYLCEVLYTWFVPKEGKILDPFAGGSVRGIVANCLGYDYTGIDVRQEQIDSNIEQGKQIIPEHVPNWILGDSNKVLDTLNDSFDFIFSCPPYFNLEVYSDLDDDISNTKDYNKFITLYESIIGKSVKLLKENCFACFVVGEVRNKDGNYVGFIPDTINIFKKFGMKYYNEAVLLLPVASASMRAKNNMVNKKLCKIHQNILIFKK